MQTLSFCATDFPVHAQESGKHTVVKAARLSMPHRKNAYGHHIDAGQTIEMQYDSLYPGALQGTHGREVSYLTARSATNSHIICSECTVARSVHCVCIVCTSV